MMKVGNMDTAMIALLPMTDDWCGIDLPHVTLVFAGKIEDRPPTDFNRMAKDAAALSMLARPLMLHTIGIERLGPPEEPVSALMLRPTTELMAMRNFVEKWNSSEYPDYRPHATIGAYPIDKPIAPPPPQLAFDRIMVAWGDDQLTFWLKR